MNQDDQSSRANLEAMRMGRRQVADIQSADKCVRADFFTIDVEILAKLALLGGFVSKIACEIGDDPFSPLQVNCNNFQIVRGELCSNGGFSYNGTSYRAPLATMEPPLIGHH